VPDLRAVIHDVGLLLAMHLKNTTCPESRLRNYLVTTA
jgi:hypothetical protein